MKIDDKYFLPTSKLALHSLLQINSGYQQANKPKPRRFCSFLSPGGLVYLHLYWLAVKPSARQDEALVDTPQEQFRKFILFRPRILFRSTASVPNTDSFSELRLFGLLLFYNHHHVLLFILDGQLTTSLNFYLALKKRKKASYKNFCNLDLLVIITLCLL